MRRIVLAIAVLLVGCRFRPEPVPVIASPAELALLAGEWDGDYRSDESGRSGLIFFQITARGDSAFGEVLMRVPVGETGPRPADLQTGHELHARSVEFLSIRVVSLAGGNIRGELEPYFAPDCECLARTIFFGRVEMDGVSGSFVTTTERGLPQRGVWTVRRVMPE